MDETDLQLQALRESMTEEQRQDMADLLKAELLRREKEKMYKGMAKPKSSSSNSSGLSAEDIGSVYSDADKTIRELRVKKLERELEEAKSQHKRFGKFQKEKSNVHPTSPLGQILDRGRGALSEAPRGNLRNIIVLGAIVSLASMKVVFSSGVVDASVSMGKGGSEQAAQSPRAALDMPRSELTQASIEMMNSQSAPGNWSETDKRLLTSLDARRVELEKRSSILEKREAELQAQTQALNERLAELRGLTQRLADNRKEKDQRYEARMEQLANVYSSMAPTEAAPLVAKLDDHIGIALLERMPGKRMGQILGLMSPDRAIELTRILTERGKL